MALDYSKIDDFRHGSAHQAKKCRNLLLYKYYADQINILEQNSDYS
jgi:hypothetical protein